MHRLIAVMALSTIMTLAVSSPGFAQAGARKTEGPTPDEKAMHDYVLTVDKMQKYGGLMKKVQQSNGDPAVAAEMQKITDVDAYNVEKADMMAKSPKLMALFGGTGLTPRDFVLIPLTIMSAGTVAQNPSAAATMPYITPAQVQFYKDHKADLAKWGLQ